MPQPLLQRAVLEGIAPYRDAAEQSVDWDRYARDPLLPLTEGHVQVWDPIEMCFVTFEPWPHQVELITEWVDVERLAETGELRFRNRIVEKTRQMGDTVAVSYTILWSLTYHDAPLLVQHQDLNKVDDGGEASTWNSLFGKVRIMHETWPAEIGKARFRFRGGIDPLIRNLDHPQRFANGEGATPNPGRGGRFAGVVVDEAAYIRYDRQGRAALAVACPVGQMMLSTPNGRGNVYYQLRAAPPPTWRLLTHHWTRHPLYSAGMHVAGEDPEGCERCALVAAGLEWTPDDQRPHRFPGKMTSPWYEAQCAELLDDELIARELDIDYAGALTARVFPEFNAVQHVLDDIPYDPALKVELSFDYGMDVTHVGIWQDAPDSLRKIGEVELADAIPEVVADAIRDELAALGVPDKERLPRFTRDWLAVGDPSGEAKQLATARSLVDDYFTAGFSIDKPIAPSDQLVGVTIRAMKRLLLGRPKPVRYSRRGCPLSIEHMEQNRWPVDAQGNRRESATKPRDDVHNHCARADAYYVFYKFPPPPDQTPAPPEDEAVRRRPGVSTDVRYGDVL